MTQTILNFPVRNAERLRCVWLETGNPAQPLVCKWVSGKQACSAQAIEIEDDPHRRRLCA